MRREPGLQRDYYDLLYPLPSSKFDLSFSPILCVSFNGDRFLTEKTEDELES